MKYCSKCNTEKPISEFYKNSSSADGYRSECIDCHRKHLQKTNKCKVCGNPCYKDAIYCANHNPGSGNMKEWEKTAYDRDMASEIASMYKYGWSMKRLTKEYGVSRATITRYVSKFGDKYKRRS